MKIPGIHSRLYMSAKFTWPGERRPSSELTELIDLAPSKITPQSIAEAEAILRRIEQFKLEPSQMMRLRFLTGQLRAESHDYNLAFLQYYDALLIADDHEDIDSRITLAHLAGRMMYGMMRNQDALSYFQEALNLWNMRAEQLADPRIEPTVKFQERIGTVQWILGNFEDAHVTLARSLTLAIYKNGGRRSAFLRRTTADALWSLGLTLRSQSDMCDGDSSLLKRAITRMKQAQSIYAKSRGYRTARGRLDIQIAELYLDRAEMCLLRGHADSASEMRRSALRHLKRASEFIEPDIDPKGVWLLRVAQLRCSITTSPERNAARTSQTFETEVLRIKRQAEQTGDDFLLGKLALVRGEWLLWLGRLEPARVALLEAISAFQNEGMGMATRAQRLLRRSNAAVQAFAPRRAGKGPAAPSTGTTPP